eukprot:c19279_g1_i2.p1 GENE.c19279_g1_i2~~c19279_g1_i2.p1  ORF type:complete len:446 (+),score=124.06 c19279_g1_i2:29-1339(+)
MSLSESTYLSEQELQSLRKRFTEKFKGRSVINKEEFIRACCNVKGASFVAGRLFDVFQLQAVDRGVTNGIDFEAYAHIISTFGPNAPLEKKMFVCFKVFDIHDTNILTKEGVSSGVARVLCDYGYHVSDKILEEITQRTFKEAGCDATTGISYRKFQVLFIRSPILVFHHTLSLWDIVDQEEDIQHESLFFEEERNRGYNFHAYESRYSRNCHNSSPQFSLNSSSPSSRASQSPKSVQFSPSSPSVSAKERSSSLPNSFQGFGSPSLNRRYQMALQSSSSSPWTRSSLASSKGTEKSDDEEDDDDNDSEFERIKTNDLLRSIEEEKRLYNEKIWNDSTKAITTKEGGGGSDKSEKGDKADKSEKGSKSPLHCFGLSPSRHHKQRSSPKAFIIRKLRSHSSTDLGTTTNERPTSKPSRQSNFVANFKRFSLRSAKET